MTETDLDIDLRRRLLECREDMRARGYSLSGINASLFTVARRIPAQKKEVKILPDFVKWVFEVLHFTLIRSKFE